MPQPTFATRVRLSRLQVLLAALLLAAAALACNLGAQPQGVTATPQGNATLVAQSDVPEVEIRNPADNSEVVLNTEVQVYVRAVDKVGVTRIEMRADNLIVDTAASPEANGNPTMESILSWTPNSPGNHVIQVVAFRGNTRGNPRQITLIVRSNAAQVTRPAGSPAALTASPTGDPTCRVRVDTDQLNLRRGPGVNYDRIANLGVGSYVPVTGTIADRSWYQVNVQGMLGWVSSYYVTPFGICTNLFNVQVPPSPTVAQGQPTFFIPATFTPLPTLQLPTQTSTIPVVVLPTLTWTPVPTKGAGQASVGDLTSTAIFATQTKLAQPNTPTQAPPTNTNQPGITPTITNTPTLTPTPLLPNLVINSVATSSDTIVLDSVSKLATVPFIIQISNQGDAPAPVFKVSIDQPDGTRITTATNIILNAKSQTELTMNVPFTEKSQGSVRLTVIADSGNDIVESNESDNVAFKDVNVLIATKVGETSTFTPTPTTASTETPSVTPTETPTNTPELPTLVGAPTETPSNTPDNTQPTATFTNTPEQVQPTETFTNTPEQVLPTETPTNTQEVAVVPTNTNTPEPPTLVPPTETPTQEPPTLIPPTETPTETPVPPTEVPTNTNTPEPPTLVPPTETPTQEPPTAIPPTETPVPPTETPIPPTEVPTNTPEPPTAEPPTVEPPTAEPPTATPTTQAPAGTDMLTVPVVPNVNPVKNEIKTINTNGQGQGVQNNNFKILGDKTLADAANIVGQNSNLDQFFPNLSPVRDYFNAGIADANGATSNGGFSSGDILNPNKSQAPCEAGKSPLDCALAAKPALIFIEVGRADVQQNVPLDQFRNNVTAAVQAAVNAGTVPVLVTITGADPNNEAKVSEYNNVLLDIANTTKVPLLNLYALRSTPTTVDPNSGGLTGAGSGQADFSPQGLQQGANAANLSLLQTLEAIKNALGLQ